MAAPLKRVCRQAVRPRSHYRIQTPRSSFTESTQLQQLRLQQRLFSTPSHLSQQAEHEDLDTYLEPVEESLPDPRELSSTAHSELDQHREIRELVRLAAWEMPLLAQHAKPFAAIDRKKLPLKWRYTTYFGESHPASRKVVVQFVVKHVTQGWNQVQIDKLKKLAGSRYKQDMIHMSCESFETQAQNKRYLADTINKLLAEAQDLSEDSFEDVPLDMRHDRRKKRLTYQQDFPKEWKLDPEKREALEEKRKTMLLEEAKLVEEGKVISGAAAIEYDRKVKLSQVEKPVMVEALRSLPAGKMGKKQMGQKGR